MTVNTDRAKALLDQIAADSAKQAADNVALRSENAALRAQLKGVPTTPSQGVPASAIDPRFQLVVDEQFTYADGPAKDRLSSSRWWEPYDGVPGTEGVGMRNGALATIRNGNLVVAAQRPSNTSTDFNEWLSTGCAMGPVAQIYGRWEVVAKCSRGAGFWLNGMLWQTNDSWPPVEVEVDIFETPKPDRSEAVTTIHYGRDNMDQSRTTRGDFTQFHTWVVEWTPGLLVITCDGSTIWSVTDKAMVPNTLHHLCLQTDMGEWAGRPTPSDPVRAELEVDRVRQWKYVA